MKIKAPRTHSLDHFPIASRKHERSISSPTANLQSLANPAIALFARWFVSIYVDSRFVRAIGKTAGGGIHSASEGTVKVFQKHCAFQTLDEMVLTDNSNVFIKARPKEPSALQKEILLATTSKTSKNLLILDTLHPISTHPTLPIPLTTFLCSLISPSTSLLATYHLDIPLPTKSLSPSAYNPTPLALLRYLATTLITVHSLSQILARKRASERSVAEPLFGLADDGTEGVLVGMGANDTRGVVLEVECRRKSGRGVGEWYFLPAATAAETRTPVASIGGKERIVLLEDHSLYRMLVREEKEVAGGEEETTFNLGLTEKQRRDREGVVLPYFDAQKEGGGGGEGGRILYDLGVEDDFDEEEDEI
ncbi:MAG: hypothetical protein MMC33_009541 [Icmadophila ericetorum]|nr:hypothetical protein [Icmadophila ericetorum]